MVRKELSNLSNQTISALETLLASHSPQDVASAARENSASKKSIEDLRATMAANQVRLVEALEAAVGHDQATKLCRDTLFTVGRTLGEDARSRLGVGDSQRDLIKAAKLLYRILGIRFELEWIDSTHLKMIIDRCPLVSQYSKFTCEVLSATDEGAITGLQPGAAMQFTRYMTEGCRKCTADIRFEETETAK